MAGVFLSYSRADRSLADRVIRELRAIGLEVWWDQDMPGVNWQDELERQVTQLAALVVVWTPNSAASAYVKDEARLALASDKLVNLLFGAPKPPFPFDRVNALALDGWDGRAPHPQWRLAVETIEAHMVRQGQIRDGALAQALSERLDAIRRAQDAVEHGEAEYAAASAAVEESAAEAKRAHELLTEAQDKFQKIVELRAASKIIAVAQEDLDAQARASRQADAAWDAAKARLDAASQALKGAEANHARLFEPVAPAQADVHLRPAPPWPPPIPAPSREPAHAPIQAHASEPAPALMAVGGSAAALAASPVVAAAAAPRERLPMAAVMIALGGILLCWLPVIGLVCPTLALAAGVIALSRQYRGWMTYLTFGLGAAEIVVSVIMLLVFSHA